jgi:hypothetical protein
MAVSFSEIGIVDAQDCDPRTAVLGTLTMFQAEL